ncbi:hypothetical protein [Streptomyces paludis]|nr:hypothetical protein [Streptomyces paludis]
MRLLGRRSHDSRRMSPSAEQLGYVIAVLVIGGSLAFAVWRG